MSTDAEIFLNTLAAKMPADERLITCGFLGDPFTQESNAWKPYPWRPSKDLGFTQNHNVYVTVASFGRAPDNSFRRRKSTFSAGYALMVDDVGTKVDEKVVSGLKPTMIVETSPGNHQFWYCLSQPERDADRFDGVIRAFISGRLLGADPGMSGITRVGRVPGFTNGKPAHNGWKCLLKEVNDTRYTTQELLDGFGLKINGTRVVREKLHNEQAIERNRAFTAAYKFLDRRGILKRSEPDPSGWIEIHCPWRSSHTNSADNGAAIREPAPENDFYGSMVCHHGHCIQKGWSDLADWIAELAAEELNDSAAAE